MQKSDVIQEEDEDNIRPTTVVTIEGSRNTKYDRNASEVGQMPKISIDEIDDSKSNELSRKNTMKLRTSEPIHSPGFGKS